MHGHVSASLDNPPGLENCKQAVRHTHMTFLKCVTVAFLIYIVRLHIRTCTSIVRIDPPFRASHFNALSKYILVHVHCTCICVYTMYIQCSHKCVCGTCSHYGMLWCRYSPSLGTTTEMSTNQAFWPRRGCCHRGECSNTNIEHAFTISHPTSLPHTH